MSLDSHTKKQIRYYAGLLLEGQLDEREFAAFQDLLRNNAEAQDYYLDLLDINVSLRKLDWTLEKLGLRSTDVFDRELWSALSYTENNAPAIPVQKQDFAPHAFVQKLDVPKSPRHVSRVSLIAVFTSLAAMLLMLAYVYFNPQPNSASVAVIVDSLDAVWANPSQAPGRGDVICAGDRKHVLVSGTIKIDSLLGPQMIIEGPSLFEFADINKIIMYSGRIFVKVPSNAIGYTVLAPTFSVIDLGTEFGVSVDADGSGDVFMYSGKASLVAGTQGQTRGSHLLTEGSAKHVFAIDCQVEDIPFNPTLFVRDLSSQDKTLWRGQSVDLADIVGGGNGLGTGRIGFGIEPVKGALSAYEIPGEAIRQGTGDYVPITSDGLLDGIFVPDGGRGPVQVSSRGHTFDTCPDTEGVFWMPAMNGGSFAHYPGASQGLLRLGEKECGTSSRPAIFLHSNLGITFDLNAIRRMIPSAELKEFRAVCGISDSGPQRSACADFWVLTDGKVRFSQTGTGPSEIYSICVPIAKEDQYLTLMSTDGGRGTCLTVDGIPYPIDSDWCVFAEPVLTLQSK